MAMKKVRTSFRSSLILLALAALAGCGGGGDPVPVEVDQEATRAGTLFPDLEGDAIDPSAGASPSVAPTSFVDADVGGWQRGQAVSTDTSDGTTEDGDGRADSCGSILTGVL